MLALACRHRVAWRAECPLISHLFVCRNLQLCEETRTSGSKQVWQMLKNACEADPEDAKAII